MIVTELQHALGSRAVIRGRASAVVTVVAATLLMASVAAVTPARADPGDDAAQQAAGEIQAARDRANQAAAEYSQAQFELEALEERATELAAQQAQLEAEVEALRATVEQVAVNRFVASGTSGIPLLTGYREPAEQLQADVLVNVVTESSADAMDDFDHARDELEANQREVADTQDELADKQEQFKQLQAAAEAEVVHLQEVEAKRLGAVELPFLELERRRELLLRERHVVVQPRDDDVVEAHRLEHFGEVRVQEVEHDDDGRVAVAELVLHLARGVKRVVADHDRPEPRGRVEGDRVLGAVRHDERHPVPLADPEPGQRGRQRSTSFRSSA